MSRTVGIAPLNAVRRALSVAAPLYMSLLVGCEAEGFMYIVPDKTPHETTDTSDPGDTADSGETGDSADTDDSSPVIALDWALHPDMTSLVYATWTQEESATVRVEYSVDEGVWLESPTLERSAGEQEQLLLGIPFDMDFSLRLVYVVADEEREVGMAQGRTGALPSGFWAPDRIVFVDNERDPTANYLLGSLNDETCGWCDGNHWTFILDRQGRPVWARLTENQAWTLFPSVSIDGTSLLIDEFTYWSDWSEGEDSTVYRLRIDLSEVESYATPGGHHAFAETQDGTILWGAASWSGEELREVDRGGDERLVWDCTGCQSNCIFWNSDTDSILYSFYTNDTVYEIDRDSGDTLRQFGQARDSWDFNPSESMFSWQHGVSYTDSGTLLVSTAAGSETEVREYELDDTHETLDLVWSFGEGQGVYADTNGDARRLPGGNTLHSYGSAGRIREVTSDNDLVLDLDFGEGYLIGRTEYIEDLYRLAP